MANILIPPVYGAKLVGAGSDDARGDFGSVAFLVEVSEGFEGDRVLCSIGSCGDDCAVLLH